MDNLPIQPETLYETGLPITQHFRVVAILNPLKFGAVEETLPVGVSVAETLKKLGIPLGTYAHVSLNGLLIPRSEYETWFPTSGSLLTVRVAFSGGGSNVAAMLQVLAGAAMIAVGVLVPGMQFLIVSGGMMMLGGVLSMVMPPSTPKSKLSGTPQLYTISGNQNGIAPYAPVPFPLGKRKVTPTYYADPFSETYAEKQYVRILASTGYGPVDISNIKIKNTLLTSYQAVQLEIRAGYPDDAPITIFKNIPHQDDFSVLLLDSADDNIVGTGWQRRTTVPDVEEIAVDFSFPNGLRTVNDVGNPRWLKVFITIRYALTGTDHGISGDDNWSTRPILETMGLTGIVGAWNSGALLNTDQWTVDQGQYDVECEVSSVTCNPNGSLTSPDVISADTYWIALRTFRSGNPVLIPGQALIALRIQGTGQLNGAITDLTAIVNSIMPDWNPDDASWVKRAGSWDYDYEKFGSGAAGFDLDEAEAYNGMGRALRIDLNGSGDGTRIASKVFSVRGPRPATNTVPAYVGDKLSVSVRYKASRAISSGMYARVIFSKGLAPNADPLYAGSEDFDPGQILSSVDLLNNAAATTGWQQVINASITVPKFDLTQVNVRNPDGTWSSVIAGGMGWVRLEIGCTSPDGSPLSVYFDDSSGIILSADDSEQENAIPNPSFDYPGQKTSNPASHFRQVLQQDRGVGATLPDNRLDLTALEDWHVKCAAAKNFHDAIFDQKINIQSALEQICAVGRAALRQTDGYYSIVLDEADKLPKQHFTPRNLKGYSWEAPFADFPHALRCRYADATLDYEVQEVVAYWDAYSPNGPEAIIDEKWGFGDGTSVTITSTLAAIPIAENSLAISCGGIIGDDDGAGNITGTGITVGTIAYDTGVISITFSVAPAANEPALASYNGYANTAIATLFETLDLSDRMTDRFEAWRFGRFMLAVSRLRTIVHNWSADLEHIISQRGDVVYLQHPTPNFGLGAARVKEVLTSGTDTIGVTVDDTFTLKANIQYVVRFRLADLSSLLVDISQVTIDTNTNTLSFSAPITTGNPVPEVGDLLSLGDPVKLMITGLASGNDYQEGSFKAVAYDPNIYTAEDDIRLFDKFNILDGGGGSTVATTPGLIMGVGYELLIAISRDGGDTFEQTVITYAGGQGFPYFYEAGYDGDQTIIATGTVIYTSHDQGKTFNMTFDPGSIFLLISTGDGGVSGGVSPNFTAAVQWGGGPNRRKWVVAVGEYDVEFVYPTSIVSGGGIFVSDDNGDTWTPLYFRDTITYSIVYSPELDRFVVGALGGTFWADASSDLKQAGSWNWVPFVTVGWYGTLGIAFTTLVWNGKIFVGYDDNFTTCIAGRSSDGKAWLEVDNLTTPNAGFNTGGTGSGVWYDPRTDQWLAIGGSYQSSAWKYGFFTSPGDDGVMFTSRIETYPVPDPDFANLTRFAADFESLWLFGLQGLVGRSIDTHNWVVKRAYGSTTYDIEPVGYNGKYFAGELVDVASNHFIAVSRDRLNWTNKFADVSQDIVCFYVYPPRKVLSSGLPLSQPTISQVTSGNGGILIDLATSVVPASSPDSTVHVMYRRSSLNEGLDRGTWNETVTYASGDLIRYKEVIWQSLVGSNLNNVPGVDATKWTSLTSHDAWEDMQPQVAHGGKFRLTKNIQAGTIYDIRVRYESASGHFGPWTETAHQVLASADSEIPGPVTFGTAPPTSGIWQRGWVRFSTLASAGGNGGWICVEGNSTGGVWKEFSQVQA